MFWHKVGIPPVMLALGLGLALPAVLSAPLAAETPKEPQTTTPSAEAPTSRRAGLLEVVNPGGATYVIYRAGSTSPRVASHHDNNRFSLPGGRYDVWTRDRLIGTFEVLEGQTTAVTLDTGVLEVINPGGATYSIRFAGDHDRQIVSHRDTRGFGLPADRYDVLIGDRLFGTFEVKRGQATAATLLDPEVLQAFGPGRQAADAEDQYVRCVQLLLTGSGYDAGAVDGLFGPRTRTAADTYRDEETSASRLPALTDDNAARWCEALAARWDCAMGNSYGGYVARGGMGRTADANISPGWYYNNDWGKFSMSGLPPVYSCMARDGAGWVFDVARFAPRGWPEYYHSPTLLFGHKGWDNPGNRLVRDVGFPVLAGDVDMLRFEADFTFSVARAGMMNNHISLWFVRNNGVTRDAWRRQPFLEMMVKITNDRDIDSCTERGKRSGRFNFQGDRIAYCYRGDEAFVHDFASWEANLPGAKRHIGGRHVVDLPMHEVIDLALEQGWITSDDVLLGVEFQTEIGEGTAHMRIDDMSVRLERVN